METETRIRALATHLDCNLDLITESSYDERLLEIDNNDKFPDEYLVLTDDEADIDWDERLENYLDDCVLCELPDELQMYFDTEKWKRDARIDGRGHSISSYDGCEYDVKVNGETLYIFRMN